MKITRNQTIVILPFILSIGGGLITKLILFLFSIPKSFGIVIFLCVIIILGYLMFHLIDFINKNNKPKL